MRSSGRPRPRDWKRGEGIAALAGAQKAEAIVTAIEPENRYPERRPAELEMSRHRNVAKGVARVERGWMANAIVGPGREAFASMDERAGLMDWADVFAGGGRARLHRVAGGG